jgi:hypothetical protein
MITLHLPLADLPVAISDSIRAVLRAHNYAIVRNADTTYASDERDEAFAVEAGRNAAQCLCAHDVDGMPLGTMLWFVQEMIRTARAAANTDGQDEIADGLYAVGGCLRDMIIKLAVQQAQVKTEAA